jgi:hypothetical protein
LLNLVTLVPISGTTHSASALGRSNQCGRRIVSAFDITTSMALGTEQYKVRQCRVSVVEDEVRIIL